MMDIQSARINTAGAYVCISGLYLFSIGIQPFNGHIPIIRLGGHRDKHETGWQCAEREVYEEANLRIKPLLPQTTYLSDWDFLDGELKEIPWGRVEQQPVPILVVSYRREEKTSLSLMYLADADGIPIPSSEVKGLLLLEKEEIHSLCQKPMTLEQYLSKGGKAVLNGEFDTSLVLEPFAQLRLFSRILSMQPEIKAAPNRGQPSYCIPK